MKRPISSCATVYPDPHRMTSSDCATSCAYDSTCLAWLHDPAGRACSHAGAGASCVPATSNATTIGGIRAAPTPLQTSYAFAAASLPAAASWEVVAAPHDGLASLAGSFSEAGSDQRHGYRVRTVLWYRKSFELPAAWAPGPSSGATVLRFEGVMHYAQVWLNGVYLVEHASAYGAFTIRLDNATSAMFGGQNVLAVRADASYGSEHWYGGGGITRPVQLVHFSAPQSLVEGGLWVPPELPFNSTTVAATAEWENFAATAASGAVKFDLYSAQGALLATATSGATNAPSSGGGHRHRGHPARAAS